LSKAALYNIFDNSPKVQKNDRLQENNQTKLHLDGLLGSAVSFLIRALFKKSDAFLIILNNNKEEAAYY
jgi:transcription-repair coupling factor (superfamily II helicase)